MLKARAWFSIATSTALLAGVVLACEESKDSDFDEKNDAAADFDSGPGFQLDGGPPVNEAGAATCTAARPAGFQPRPWAAPPTPQDVCTQNQLINYFQTCVSGELDGGPKCSGFRELEANRACTACLEPDGGTGPIVVLDEEHLNHVLNVAACMAMLRGETADNACPALYDRSVQCQRASCQDCIRRNAASSEYAKCQDNARSTQCQGYEAELKKAVDAGGCGDDFINEANPDYGCHSEKYPNAQAHWTTFMSFFCGPR